MPPRPRRVAAVLLSGVVAMGVLAGCGGSSETPPEPSPQDPDQATSGADPQLGAWHRLVPDPGGEGVLLVNGYPETEPGTEPLELWRWEGDRWSELSTADGPSGRNFAAVAVDTDRGALVVQGGQTAMGTSSETWEWDGSAWRLVSTKGPGPRVAAEMAYEAATRRVLLYGGDDGSMTLKRDTWAWNGDTWAQVATAGPTPVRFPAMMAYDEQRREVVLYGGHQVADEQAPPALGDTWIWTEGAWLLAESRSAPGVLVNAAGLSHPDLGLLLVGGSDFDDETGEIWKWTGRSWLALGSDIIPGRQAFGLALDPGRDVVVMTGGVVEPGSVERHQDVWEWDGEPAHPAEVVRE